jgi:hypothetical protein
MQYLPLGFINSHYLKHGPLAHKYLAITRSHSRRAPIHEAGRAERRTQKDRPAHLPQKLYHHWKKSRLRLSLSSDDLHLIVSITSTYVFRLRSLARLIAAATIYALLSGIKENLSMHERSEIRSSLLSEHAASAYFIDCPCERSGTSSSSGAAVFCFS